MPPNAAYYRQRATRGGLIICEASQVAPEGRGVPATPGIHSPEQVDGWRAVVDAIHDEGGIAFLQLWYERGVSLGAWRGRRTRRTDRGAVPEVMVYVNSGRPMAISVVSSVSRS